jgi:alkanesulfonate monooxygenase SsuD/methylene tetrahydromethanopterin reductase-like flavin-dependent oxidoreductase (luciferase family)
VRYGICVPNLGEFTDPRAVAGLARRAEDAGWDGFFTWDHVVFPFGPLEVADPWVLLTAVALATDRIRVGPLVDFRGEHFTAADVTFTPTPAQRPRPPVWIGCNWPNRLPLRRAARWDGVAPHVLNPADGSWAPTPEAVTQIVAAVGEHRDGTGPFDVVITGRTQPAEPEAARETTGSIAAAGATWWLEGFRPGPGEYEAALRRVDAGPPA